MPRQNGDGHEDGTKCCGSGNRKRVWKLLWKSDFANLSSAVQLSFITKTQYGTGAPPTVTVTPLAETVTQMVTVTANVAAAGTGNVGSGSGMGNGANATQAAGEFEFISSK